MSTLYCDPGQLKILRRKCRSMFRSSDQKINCTSNLQSTSSVKMNSKYITIFLQSSYFFLTKKNLLLLWRLQQQQNKVCSTSQQLPGSRHFYAGYASVAHITRAVSRRIVLYKPVAACKIIISTGYSQPPVPR